MSCMATTTTNLGLTKPDYTDAADIAVINTNMDTVDTAITATKSDLGIVEDGNTATHSITAGQYVIWKGNLYTAKSAIATGTTLSTSNLTAVSNGGLNSLNEQIRTLNWKTLYSNTTFQNDVGRQISIDTTGIKLLDVMFYDTSISAGNRFRLLLPCDGTLGATYFATGVDSTFDIVRVQVSSGNFQLLSHRNSTSICVGGIYGKA